MGVIGSAASGIGALGSALGGKGAAGGQPFQSAGGVTPQQAESAQYTYGQNLVKDATQFQGEGEGGGTGISTMATNAAGGSAMQKALDLGQTSDVNQTAQYNAYRNQQAFANTGMTNLGQIANLASGLLKPSSNTGAAQDVNTTGVDTTFSNLPSNTFG